ncbi:MAG: hypothetical protein DRH08_01800 [Deltaproteobacteria bacterium]|nr:MAG: hypothetical protein DRH08_01800 [Deltaproteobacteria bacterium]
MSLSLDDQKKLAIAAGHEARRSCGEIVFPTDMFNEYATFNPKSPDTLMRLIENLELDVGKDIGNVWRASKNNGQHTKWRETLADAILECSMAVLNNG